MWCERGLNPENRVAQHFIQQKELYMIDTCIKVCQVPSSGVQPNVSKAFAKDRRTSHVHNRHVHMDVPSSCAVTVEGVSKRTSEQFLIMHFENRLRTGGGKIRDIYRGPSETGIYTITFEEPEVARRVFQKRHSLDDHILEVHQLPSAKMELDNKPVKTDLALVYDIPDHIDSYHLLRHFEELTKCHIKEITYGLNPSLALLEFGEPIDFLSLAHHCIKYPLFGAMLGVEPVPTSLSVQVFGIDNIYNDPLEMYFESNKHSGGCEEVKVELQKEHGCAIVRCPSTKVLKEILSRNHELSGQTLKVDTYYSCLGPLPPGLDRHSPIRIPKGAFVPLPGKEEGDFLRKSATARQQMDMVLKKLHGSVTWDDPDSSEDHLYIHCTLRNNDQKALSLAQNWEKNVRSAANSFLANLCSQSKDVLQEIWPKLREYIDHSRFTQEQIKLGLDDKTCRLTITGFRDKVTHVFDDLNEKIKILQDEMDRAAQTICEKVHLKAIECQLLLGMKSQEKLVQNWPGLNIEINIETENVAFEGVLKDVLNAKAEMLQLIHSMPSEKYKVNDKRMRLLSQKETHDYISEQLHQQNIVAVWEIDEDDLIIQSQNPKDNRRVLGIINSEIDSIQFDIPEASRPILTSDTWYKLKADVQSDKQGLVIVETNSDNSVLEIVGKNTLVHGLLENVRSFFDENTILEEMVALQLGFVEVIVRYMGDNIHAIEKDFASCAVGISTTKSKDGFQIKGNKDGLVQAKKRLLKLAESVVFRQHEIIHPGMPKYFRSRGGRTNLNSLQTEYSVMIYTDADKPFETPNTPLQATGPQEICRVKHPNGPLIIVFVDDMPSHACDVIVNPANGDLKHAGGLARALSDKGGPEIQRQSDEYVQRKGKVQEGCVAVTGAGKLPCKKLIHAVGPKYNGGYKNEENLLYEVTWACLETAETPRVSSIAIPAISTGVFAFPLQKACQTIVEAIKEYFQNPKYHTLREIHLVDNEMQTAQALRTAVEQAYGMSPKVQGASAARPRHANIPRDIPDPVDPSEYLHIHSVRAASPVKEDDNQLSATAASPVKEHDNQLRTNEGVTITLIDGEIGCQEVDVIVNTCSQNFNLNQGAVSNALLLAAGPGLQAEVKKQVPEGVKHGQIVATSGHKLPCSQVYHGSCPNWNGGAGNSEEILRNFVKGTLIKANLDGHSSIALPAIGTGNLQYPRDFVAHAMFEEAKEFSKTTRDLSLTDIFFVVYGRNDQPTVQAFNAEMKKQGGGASLAGAGRTPKKTHRSSTAAEDIGNRAWRSSRSEVRKILEEDEEEMYGDVDILEQGQQQMKIGSIVLQVQLGDLTHENTDAIVNSTNSQLDLTQGDVSKAIVKAGGPMINHECSRLGGLTGGIAVTGAGNLPAKKIIHIEITPDPDNLKKVMKHCLQEAEKIGMSSIAFPALGTGRFTQMPEKMAAIMMECIANFCHSSQPKMLKLVRVTIFQKFMLDVFHQEMYKKAQQPKGFIQSKWDWIKGKLRTSGGGDQSEEMVHSQRKRFSGNRSPLSDRPTSSLSMPAHQRNMHMSIYGRSEINVQQTIEKIDEICDTETEEKIMGGPGSKKEAESIKKLTREQVNKIQSMDESHDVHIAITQSTKVNRIRVHGVSSDMLDIIDKIHDVFHEIDSEEWKKQHAEIIARNVHWEYLDGMKFKKYPDDINADIENACRAKQQTVEWTETGGRRYKIDFNTMKESVKGEYAPEVDVRRRDLADSTAPPDTWSNMPPDKVCLLVSLPNSSEEYNDVEQQFMLTIQGKCQHILQIERIQNPALYRSYEAHKQQMNEVNPSNVENERYLFHGTDAETLKKINTNGFNRSYCGKNATLYGKGVYFAKTSKYSHQYAKVDIDGKRTMYLCQVLTGEYTKAQEDMIDTPVKDAINHIKYDSAVDDPENPSIFVIFSDVKAYPTYLITYK